MALYRHIESINEFKATNNSECAWNKYCFRLNPDNNAGTHCRNYHRYFSVHLVLHNGLPPMNGRLRIAVADDEPDMRRFLCRVLAHEGHQVVVAAESGRQLIRECQQTQPDLVITDIAMPDMDGLQAIHEICVTKAVPSIVISAKSEDDLLVRASNELVFAYLVKPIKMDDLRPAIWLTMRRFTEFTRLQAQLTGKT